MGVVFDEVSAEVAPVQQQAEPSTERDEREGNGAAAAAHDDGLVCECERRDRRRLRLLPH